MTLHRANPAASVGKPHPYCPDQAADDRDAGERRPKSPPKFIFVTCVTHKYGITMITNEVTKVAEPRAGSASTVPLHTVFPSFPLTSRGDGL